MGGREGKKKISTAVERCGTIKVEIFTVVCVGGGIVRYLSSF